MASRPVYRPGFCARRYRSGGACAIAIALLAAAIVANPMPGVALAGDASAVAEAAPPEAASPPPSAEPSLDSQGQIPASTAEIPAAQSGKAPAATSNAAPADADGSNAAPGPDGATSQNIDEYEAAQNPAPAPVPHFHSLQEFMSEGSDTSPIGVELREDRRRLSGGGQADGLLILKVHSGSPAAQAGLRGYSTTGHSVLEGAAVAAAMVFPPAVLAIAVLDQTHVGESYDMIIGVDGNRVTNYLDFEDHMRDAKPGDVVYLSIVRNGKRVQIAVPLPVTAGSVSN